MKSATICAAALLLASAAYAALPTCRVGPCDTESCEWGNVPLYCSKCGQCEDEFTLLSTTRHTWQGCFDDCAAIGKRMPCIVSNDARNALKRAMQREDPRPDRAWINYVSPEGELNDDLETWKGEAGCEATYAQWATGAPVPDIPSEVGRRLCAGMWQNKDDYSFWTDSSGCETPSQYCFCENIPCVPCGDRRKLRFGHHQLDGCCV